MTEAPLSAAEIEALFTTDGAFHFARWGRPIAPVIFGVDDASLSYLKTAIAAAVGVTGHQIADTDPELGANLLIFFCGEWDDIGNIPNLEKLVPDLGSVLSRLTAQNGTQYRHLSFETSGAIQLCVILLRAVDTLADQPIQTLATGQICQCLLSWAPDAFATESPIAVIESNGVCIIKPRFAALIRAAYDPALPDCDSEPALALRLAARAQLLVSEVADEPPSV